MANKMKAAWAINPFIDTRPHLRQMKGLVKKLTPGIQAEPVFVVSPVETGLLLMSNSLKPSHLKKVASHVLDAVVDSWPKNDVSLLPPQVLYEKGLKISDSAKKLAQHATHAGCELIVIRTRGSAEAEFFGLGSFARALLHASKIPVLAINPKYKTARAVDHLVYATDLSKESEKVFAKFCKLASSLKAKKVEILYILPCPAAWTTASMAAPFPGLPALDVPNYMEETRAFAKDRSVAFLNVARRMKVPTNFVIVESDESVADAIERFVRKRSADLLGLVSTTGRFWGSVLGATSYKLIGRSALPVWVARP
jgi:nucleotide-binding universal stress UspA family protein